MLVIAHRGASFDLPENTLPAFERAIEVGADYVEFDVHNDLSVTHDRPKRGVTYPTLGEVIELCRGRIGVMVELKRPRGDTVRRALAASATTQCSSASSMRRWMRRAGCGRGSGRCSTSASASASAAQQQGAWAAGFQNERVTQPRPADGSAARSRDDSSSP